MKRKRRETVVLKREINKSKKRSETRMTGFSMNEEGKTNFGAFKGYCFFFRGIFCSIHVDIQRIPCALHAHT